MSSFSQKKARVKATRRRTKKRMLREMAASSAGGAAPGGRCADEFASAGERKRLRLYAHQRQNKGAPGKLHMNITPGDCQSTAHRCALVSSRTSRWTGSDAR